MARTLKTRWMTLRLSKAESQQLTVLRAACELIDLERLSIKELLRRLIDDALAQHAAGRLVLPLDRSVPSLERALVEEQISIELTGETARALSRVLFDLELDYSAPDIVRTIIKREAAQYAKRVKVVK